MTSPDPGRLPDLLSPGLEPWFRRPSRLGVDSAWYGHLPFAQWIVRAAQPGLLVELGTHAGVSYAGFCDAVLAEGLPTRCFAIDSWTGDEHAGFYGEDIYADLARYHARHYGGFSRLLRCRFDEARDDFPDGSIDLLHIDGRHRLEDVGHDFTHWLPKLSERAIVLLHDTNVREGDFGVWRFWEQQRRSYPSFEFLHAHGLGVLAVGPQAPASVLQLCATSGSRDAALLRERFALLGERWEVDAALSSGQQHAKVIALGEQVQQADQYIRYQAIEFGLLRSALANEKVARHQAELDRDRQLETAAKQIEAVRQSLTTQCNDAQEQARLAEAERDALRDALHDVHELVEAGRLRAQADLAAARASYNRALAAVEQHRLEAGIIRSSLSWRLTGPLRRIVDTLRPRPAPLAISPVAPAMAHDADAGAAWEQADAGPLEEVGAMPAEAAFAEPPSTEPRSDETVPGEPELVEAECGETPDASVVVRPRRAIAHILFVIGEPGTPGATYRCRRNAAACRAAGYTTETVDLYDVNPENLARADLLVVWRAAMSPHIETMFRLAREAGTRIAFDIDDLMTRPDLARIEIIDGIRTIGTTESATRGYFEGMLRTLHGADFCVTTTAELATELRLQCDVAHVLPNVFEEETLRRARYALRRRQETGDDGVLRLGYAGGTRTHQRDFAAAAPALARVLRSRPQAMLVLFREAGNKNGLLQMDEFLEFEGLEERIEWRDMVPLDTLPEELARFDISLCPLEVGNVFCEAKSELKYFEAALAGVCTVASPTGSYRRAIRDGITGFLAADDATWEAALLRLIDEPGLRRTIATSAYHDVLWRFGPWRQAELAAILVGGLAPSRAGDAQVARCIELGLRRGDYLARGVPEIPPSELLFSHDALGEADVTVVMTSYNYAAHILEALDSVRAQTLETIDLAIVDDGSSDESVPLVLEWAKLHRNRFNRIRILRTLGNAGLGGARNVVFDAAETQWLMALDSDNRLLPEACETLLRAVREQPRAAFAYPRLRQFGDSDAIMGEHPFEPWRLQVGNYIDAMAMIAKWAWAAAGGYYVRRNAMGWEDFDLWLNLVELGQFGVAVPEVLAEYRVHASSMVNAITEQAANKQEMVAFVEERHSWLRLRTRTARQRVT
ncbi:glycosyltransferase [Lichenicoccus roseus]|uniref:Glycosyltransferase n=1 Tax=Lichenicoccus roseus TaxID=2683649 RepID=A0A5R9IZB3_9PROT|nr:glycosyltransferase [Lichenicoccus roseus]TLU70820.1 glycosyltransferase [Lichenicoccus roseus]